MDELVCSSWADFLSCELGKLPFVYLGLPVGARPRDKKVWEKVVEKITSRLERWENRFLSFGGRITLINLVLTSLLIYYLSFFKAPTHVLN